MELLAPAGNVDNFYAALQAGADAVYLGAPGINARNLSRDLSFAELGAMIDYAHEHDKKVYVAANSLILERDLRHLLKSLALLSQLRPDALIVQDIGLARLARLYFPDLTLHASTLMGAASSLNVQYFGAQGFERVVLARELTLKEITDICKRVDTELEVFVHGAMCYSFSGLCLFSSFLGGKSGLRGRCVQPCRRGYTWQGHGSSKKKRGTGVKSDARKGSYVFSMNDLAGFEAVGAMQKAGVASLKIEGRLRSANYVDKIVQAYRLVIDAEDNEREDAIEAAERLALEAMARKTSSGYFFSPQPQDAITPQHSGNVGLHLGSFKSFSKEHGWLAGTIRLKHDLHVGDRLRTHAEATGERQSFTLHRLEKSGQGTEASCSGDTVKVGLPEGWPMERSGEVQLYKLDVAENPRGKNVLAERVQDFKQKVGELERLQKKRLSMLHQSVASAGKKNTTAEKRGKDRHRAKTLEIWLKTDSAKLVTSRLPFVPDVLLLGMNKKMLSQAGTIKKYLGKRIRNVVWALPPVVFEREYGRVAKQVELLIRTGYRNFQLGHLGQSMLFNGQKVWLYGDYTLNLSNSQALAAAAEKGLSGTQVAIELDREGLNSAVQGYDGLASLNTGGTRPQSARRLRLGLTVYGHPPLFTSRLAGSHLQFNKTLISPKKEQFFLKKRDQMVVTVSAQPFSLLPYLSELQGMGLDYVVLDISLAPAGGKELADIAERLSGKGKFRKLPTFNYLGKLE